MDLMLADAELSGLCDNTITAIEEVYQLGDRFVGLLEKMKAMGYVSEAMDAALTERIAIVRSALNSFYEAKDPVMTGVNQLIRTIDDIDHL